MNKTELISVKSLLARTDYQTRFKEVMGARAPQFMASICNASNQPHLADCEPRSVIAAAFVAATLDLPIDKNLGFAHIVPYKGVAQFQMGYKGFIQLALRTGQYRTINDCTIPDGVLQSYDELSGDLALDWSKRKSDRATGYACFFELTNGFRKTLYWSREKVDQHARRYSRNYSSDGSTWSKNFDAMALKTVIKAALSKYGILSIDLQRALKHDQGSQIDIESEVTYPDNGDEAVRPANLTAPSMFAAGNGQPAQPSPMSSEAPQAAPQHPALVSAHQFIEKHQIKEATAVQFLREAGWIDDSLSTFSEVADVQPSALEKLIKSAKTSLPVLKQLEGQR